jgi:ABC-type branched-subunit amino acid transport system substrate-binding protein
VRVLSAAPELEAVPGSAEFASRYTAKYGLINNYAATSYDSARVLIAAIGEAAKFGKAATTRADVIATLRGLTFEGIAYAKPVQWAEKATTNPQSSSSMSLKATDSSQSTKSAIDLRATAAIVNSGLHGGGCAGISRRRARTRPALHPRQHF